MSWGDRNCSTVMLQKRIFPIWLCSYLDYFDTRRTYFFRLSVFHQEDFEGTRPDTLLAVLLWLLPSSSLQKRSECRSGTFPCVVSSVGFILFLFEVHPPPIEEKSKTHRACRRRRKTSFLGGHPFWHLHLSPCEHLWTFANICEHLWTSLNIFQYLRTSLNYPILTVFGWDLPHRNSSGSVLARLAMRPL